MDLIALDKKVAIAIQNRFGFSNYQMLFISWTFGLVMGFSLALMLHWAFSPH
jgi:multisubunit Na+/H+ antiporter MnhB subunit